MGSSQEKSKPNRVAMIDSSITSPLRRGRRECPRKVMVLGPVSAGGVGLVMTNLLGTVVILPLSPGAGLNWN